MRVARFGWALAAVTLLGLALRLWGIGSLGDLDFDEQASFFIGSKPLGEMLTYLLGAPFEHPPLFYLLFHAWLSVVGGSETAMRMFAVGPGVVAVPLVGMAVGLVAGSRAGLLAAAALAISPLHIFYSRDARMYSLLALLAAAGLLAAAWVQARPRKRTGSAVVGALASVAGLATHYYAAFPVLGGVLGGLVALARPTGRGQEPGPLSSSPTGRGVFTGSLSPAPGERVGVRGLLQRFGAIKARNSAVLPVRAWMIGTALGAALLAVAALTWLFAASGLRTSLSATTLRWVDPAQLGWAVVQGLGSFLGGPLGAPPLHAVGAALSLGALAVLFWPSETWGAVTTQSTAPSPSPPVEARGLLESVAVWGFVATSVGVPLLMVLGRGFAPRFLVVAAPFAAAILGLAGARLPSRLLAPLVALFVGASAAGLVPLYTGYVRSDYGQAMAALRGEVRPDDAIVLNGPWQDLLYQRYGWSLPPRHLVSHSVPLDQAEAAANLADLVARHPRLWVVDAATDAADPGGVVAAWLDAHAYPRPVIEFQKALLRPYLTERPSTPLTRRAVDVEALDVRLGEIGLERWTLEPGGEARLQIIGNSASAPGPRRLFGQLVSLQEQEVWHWDGALIRDGPGRLSYRAAVALLQDAQPGSYELRVMVYEPMILPDGSRQVLRISAPATVGTIEVRAR